MSLGGAMVMVWAGMALTAVGVVLLCFGVRGRRVGATWYCRGCGFDLTGVYSEGGAGAKCSECGRELSGARAVVRGRRVRSGWKIVVGLVLVMLAVGGGGVVGYGRAKGVNWYVHMPTWVLVGLADGWMGRARGPELSELVTRVEAGDVTDGDVMMLAERALVAQAEAADGKRLWLMEWGDVFQRARDRVVIDAEKVDAFSYRAMKWGPGQRKKVAAGSTMSIRYRGGMALGATAFMGGGRLTLTSVELVSDEGVVPMTEDSGKLPTLVNTYEQGMSGTTSSRSFASGMVLRVPVVPAGEYKVRFRGTMKPAVLHHRDAAPRPSNRQVEESDYAEATARPFDDTIEVEIVPEGTSPIAVVQDAKSVEIFEKSGQLSVARFVPEGKSSSGEYLRVYLSLPSTTHALSFEATLYEVIDGKRTGRMMAMGGSMMYGGQRRVATGIGDRKPSDHLAGAEFFDVELKTNPKFAEGIDSIETVAGIRAVYRNVQVVKDLEQPWKLKGVLPESVEGVGLTAAEIKTRETSNGNGPP